MYRFFRELVFVLLRYSGIPFLLRELLQRNKVTIVVFHAPTVDRANAHFQALGKHYHIIALADYLHARTNNATEELPRKSLIITIDDGHASNFRLKPLLAESGMPVTI